MTVPDDTRLRPDGAADDEVVLPFVAAVCEGCGLGYEVDDLRLSPGEPVFDCSDCGCPVYLVGLDDLVDVIERCADCVALGSECRYHEGFAEGWDSCAALMAQWVDDEHSLIDGSHSVDTAHAAIAAVPGGGKNVAALARMTELVEAGYEFSILDLSADELGGGS